MIFNRIKKKNILFHTYTDAGGRAYNEDSVRVLPLDKSDICVVLADGLGSHGGGDVASKIVCDTLCEEYEGKADTAHLTELLQKAHRKIMLAKKTEREMKTTAVALAIEGNKAVWAHAGDSRLYHFLNGTLVFQTKDHSASQLAVMLGDITADEIRHHPSRNKILRSLGQDGDLNIECAEKELVRGRHAFLLCSDGFWENVLEVEMEETLRASSSPAEWIDRMCRILNHRVDGTHDNNTAAALWWKK